MRKLILICVVISLALLICGCMNGTADDNGSVPEFKVIMPADDSINGYRTNQTTQGDGKGTEAADRCFYINTSTQKFHLPDCTYAKQDSSNGKTVIANRDELLKSGYIPCKKCNP